MILAIDFDGVLHDQAHPVEGRKMGPPTPGAVDAMNMLRATGHKLIVHTVWGGTAAGQKTIGDWLVYYKIPFDQVTNLKPQADVYLDDKAVTFTTWRAFMELTVKEIKLPDAPEYKIAERKEPRRSPEDSYAEQCRAAFFGKG